MHTVYRLCALSFWNGIEIGCVLYKHTVYVAWPSGCDFRGKDDDDDEALQYERLYCELTDNFFVSYLTIPCLLFS